MSMSTSQERHFQTLNNQLSTINCFRTYFAMQTFFGSGEEGRLRQGYGAAAAALRSTIYFAMQMFFGSVKNLKASSPPSRPTPLCFMPPKGTRRSRTSQQFTQTVPVEICSATR